jgi:hypothetical protein
MKDCLVGALLLFVIACGEQQEVNNNAENTDTTTTESKPVLRPESVPLERETVKKEPVAEYKVRTENPLNEWYFHVRLYETPKTFHYLVKLQYEEIRGQDTLKLPNFGMMPKPETRKGPEQYSCIIGFLDKDDQFREYKKVYVKDNTLKIEAIKHYGVRGI